MSGRIACMSDDGGLVSVVLPAPQDVATFTDYETVAGLAVACHVIRQVEAFKVRAIAHLNGLRDGDRSVADEIAPEMGITRNMAMRQVFLAEALTTRLPSVLAAMEAGELDAFPASKVVDVTAPLSDDKCRQVDAALVGKLDGRDPTQVRRIARTWVNRIDKDAGARSKKRRGDRRIELHHDDDAMATLLAYLPAEIASAIYCRIDTIAKKLKTKDEPRTLEQLRADVVSDILLGKLEGYGGVVGNIFLHVPLTTALSITDHGCELAGHGPIPGEIARQIMNDPNSVWRKVLTDPASGAVLDVGRKRRRPPAALDDFVKVRDRECLAPGCHRPAQRCDVDHAIPWAHGGATAADVLDCFCKHHHFLKDVPGWNFSYNGETGSLTITTPARRTHTTQVEPISAPPIIPPVVEKNDDDQPPPF